jgi:ParB-like chromosome segregation protein Spo0J
MSSHDASKLKESLDEFGLIDKPVITIDGLIIGGHQRVAVLKKSGAREIDCEVPDRELTQKEIDKLNIMLNRVKGDFDYDILANMWEEETLFEAGFTQEELSFSETIAPEDTSEQKSGKKLRTCPSCGHEF